jgi:hypothetical protein
MNVVDVTKRWRYLDFVSPNRNPVIDTPTSSEYEWDDNGTSGSPLKAFLLPYDFVVCVEHCCDCHEHESTTQHEESRYVDSAKDVLQYLSEIIHDARLSVRLGVVRYHIINKHRIGGFEVKIVYKNAFGNVHSVILHSKLMTRKWPSKALMEKRLNKFIADEEIPHYRSVHQTFSSRRKDGPNGSYPVGFGPWHELAPSNLTWMIRGFSVDGHPVNTLAFEACSREYVDKYMAGLESSPIEWVVDSRASNNIKFDANVVVRVTKAFAPGNDQSSPPLFDRRGLLGVTLGYGDFEEPNNGPDPKSNLLLVQLKYFTGEPIQINEYDATSDSNGSEQGGCVIEEIDALEPYVSKYSGSVAMPECLCFVLLLTNIHRCRLLPIRRAGEQELIDCVTRVLHCEGSIHRTTSAAVENYADILSSLVDVPASDEVESRSRQSLFHYLRHITAHIEHFTRTAGGNERGLTGRSDCDDLDLQWSYSEDALDWIFQNYGNHSDFVNMEELHWSAVLSGLHYVGRQNQASTQAKESGRNYGFGENCTANLLCRIIVGCCLDKLAYSKLTARTGSVYKDADSADTYPDTAITSSRKGSASGAGLTSAASRKVSLANTTTATATSRKSSRADVAGTGSDPADTAEADAGNLDPRDSARSTGRSRSISQEVYSKRASRSQSTSEPVQPVVPLLPLATIVQPSLDALIGQFRNQLRECCQFIAADIQMSREADGMDQPMVEIAALTCLFQAFDGSGTGSLDIDDIRIMIKYVADIFSSDGVDKTNSLPDGIVESVSASIFVTMGKSILFSYFPV